MNPQHISERCVLAGLIPGEAFEFCRAQDAKACGQTVQGSGTSTGALFVCRGVSWRTLRAQSAML